MKVMRKHFPDEKKCPCCNWRVTVVYSFPTNPIDEEGLCAGCFMDMIVDNGLEVEP